MRHLDTIRRLALALWTGGAALFTFVLTPAIFSHYDRDAAGQVVGVLFPGYFAWGLVLGAIALACHLILEKSGRKKVTVILGAMLLISLVQAYWIEPKAAALKKEIPSFVTTPPDHPARKEFRSLHGISSSVNLANIGGGLFLLIIL